MKRASLRRILPLIVVSALVALPASADTLMDLIPPQSTNLAVGATVTSSGGWGGGSYPWQVTDGLREYNTWASGLAFYWDSSHKWVAVDMGTLNQFNMVVLWQHGTYHTPSVFTLEYWNGSAWVPITVNQRLYDLDTTQCYAPGTGSGGSTCDIYFFDPVVGSAVRWSFDPGQLSIDGSPLVHGWLYEFEVYNNNPVPEPATLLFVATGLGLLGLRKRLAAK